MFSTMNDLTVNVFDNRSNEHQSSRMFTSKLPTENHFTEKIYFVIDEVFEYLIKA